MMIKRISLSVILAATLTLSGRSYAVQGEGDLEMLSAEGLFTPADVAEMSKVREEIVQNVKDYARDEAIDGGFAIIKGDGESYVAGGVTVKFSWFRMNTIMKVGNGVVMGIQYLRGKTMEGSKPALWYLNQEGKLKYTLLDGPYLQKLYAEGWNGKAVAFTARFVGGTLTAIPDYFTAQINTFLNDSLNKGFAWLIGMDVAPTLGTVFGSATAANVGKGVAADSFAEQKNAIQNYLASPSGAVVMVDSNKKLHLVTKTPHIPVPYTTAGEMLLDMANASLKGALFRGNIAGAAIGAAGYTLGIFQNIWQLNSLTKDMEERRINQCDVAGCYVFTDDYREILKAGMIKYFNANQDDEKVSEAEHAEIVSYMKTRLVDNDEINRVYYKQDYERVKNLVQMKEKLNSPTLLANTGARKVLVDRMMNERPKVSDLAWQRVMKGNWDMSVIAVSERNGVENAYYEQAKMAVREIGSRSKTLFSPVLENLLATKLYSMSLEAGLAGKTE